MKISEEEKQNRKEAIKEYLQFFGVFAVLTGYFIYYMYSLMNPNIPINKNEHTWEELIRLHKNLKK